MLSQVPRTQRTDVCSLNADEQRGRGTAGTSQLCVVTAQGKHMGPRLHCRKASVLKTDLSRKHSGRCRKASSLSNSPTCLR